MRPANGRPIEYAKYLDARYGPGTAEAITARAYRRELWREELEQILAKYGGEASEPVSEANGPSPSSSPNPLPKGSL
jgi:hypothetical protein